MKIPRRRLALLAAAVAWLPLAAFSLVQAGFADVPGAFAFWRDVGVHARYLISVPLFILAIALTSWALRPASRRLGTPLSATSA